jgi:hypothetical protein
MTETVIFVLAGVALSRTASGADVFSLPGNTTRAGSAFFADPAAIASGGLTDRDFKCGEFFIGDLFYRDLASFTEP